MKPRPITKTTIATGLLIFFILGLIKLYVKPTFAILSVPPPQSGKQVAILPPGSALPSGIDCAVRIRQTTWEPRPQNNDENNYLAVKGTDFTIQKYSGTDLGIYLPGHATAANVLLDRIDGNFRGTTDEIIQWAACKWGMDEDMARAQAVTESNWDMAANGDGGDSWGLLQARRSTFPGSYPASKLSTAFNADFVYARWRICYEGLIDYLAEGGTGYTSGDAWGCMGVWYTGNWYGSGGGGSASGAQAYINVVKNHLNSRTWEQWSGIQITPTMGTTPSPTGQSCLKKNSGDADCDGNISLSDFEIFRKEYTGTINTMKSDFDGSNHIDLADFQIWRTGYFPLS